MGLTFLLTWAVMYFGYMVDDRVYDTVVVLVQACIVTLLTTIIAALVVPRYKYDGRSDYVQSPTLEPDHENSLQLSSAPPVRGSHHLDLRGLTITLLEMMALSERYDRNLSLVLMAVDDIDVVRDEYGDQASQRVLDEVADVLSDTLRIPDRSGVFADNRFLVILPETTVDSARQIAERVRRQIVGTDVRIDSRRRISATVSAGVTGFKSGDDPQAILDRVEAALAEANTLGSNHSIIWSPPLLDATSVTEDTSEDVGAAIECDVDEAAKLH